METKGKVSAILGAVVDVNFEGHKLPEIYNALELDNNGQKLISFSGLTLHHVAKHKARLFTGL